MAALEVVVGASFQQPAIGPEDWLPALRLFNKTPNKPT
jgi:hypothetical protein